jgi:hypothetical protein
MPLQGSGCRPEKPNLKSQIICEYGKKTDGVVELFIGHMKKNWLDAKSLESSLHLPQKLLIVIASNLFFHLFSVPTLYFMKVFWKDSQPR